MQPRHYLLIVAAIALVAHLTIAKGPLKGTTAPDGRRPVDLVICLDTSGSMTDLIDSARARLWDIVSELALAKPTPHLRVGLLTYGSPTLSTAAQGWVVRQIDLSDDLDRVYAKMMAMTTDGGEEYVGWVLNDAVRSMSWSSDPRALRMIFVAGNESADQAVERFNFRGVAEQARSRGVIINSIYCGAHPQGVAEQWDKVAIHGGGTYTAIDMQRGTVQIPTPFDPILLKLDAELNATYIPYGRHGDEGLANQAAQDINASRLGGQSRASRAAAKATGLYRNTAWDLVDAAEQNDFDLGQIQTEDLPPNMRSMTVAERRAYLENMRATRDRLRGQIGSINAERDRFLREKRSSAQPGQATLDDAMRQTIRKQAKTKGFKFAD